MLNINKLLYLLISNLTRQSHDSNKTVHLQRIRTSL